MRFVIGTRQTEDLVAVLRRVVDLGDSNLQAVWSIAPAELRAGRNDEARNLFLQDISQFAPESPGVAELEARMETTLTDRPKAHGIDVRSERLLNWEKIEHGQPFGCA